MPQKTLTGYAKMFRMLSDDTRLKIFSILNAKKMTATDILKELDITQPTLSYHLTTMCEVRILKAATKWKWTYYSIDRKGINKMIRFLDGAKEVSE